MPSHADLQRLCELGQELLMRMEYLRAEATLAEAERAATRLEDFDTLSRLYMPLQEARRQRRQRCGEGTVRLDLIASGESDEPDARQIAADYGNAQLLVAGWGSVAPALLLRQIQREGHQYAETFL